MYKKQKRIPTPIALILIIIGLSGILFVDNHFTSLTTSANIPIKPENIIVSNISNSSFTINYLTNNETISSVELMNNKSIYLDDLDNDNISRPRNTHYTTIKNLTENTLYALKIIQKGCLKNVCPEIKQSTGPTLNNYLDLPPIKGKILTEKGQPADGSIVIVSSDAISPLTSRVDSAGLWIIPLNNLRTPDLLSRPQIIDSNQIKIEVFLTPEKKSTAIIDINSIKSTQELPIMIIGNSYDFVNLQSKKDYYANFPKQNILGTSNFLDNIPMITSVNKPLEKIDLTFPRKDFDTTSDKQPRLRGVGLPNTELTITINSIPQSGKIKVNNDGIWSYRPKLPLEPGLHTVTITGYDEKGRLISVKKQFFVLKSGEQVLGDSTPSASLTPNLNNLTPTLTFSPTPIPTIINPTQTPILLPTQYPTNPPPTIRISPPPPTGNSDKLFMLITGATGILLLGIKIITIL